MPLSLDQRLQVLTTWCALQVDRKNLAGKTNKEISAMILNEMEEIAQGNAFPKAFKVICSKHQDYNVEAPSFVNREIRENYARILTAVKGSERVIPILSKIRPLVVEDISMPGDKEKEYNWSEKEYNWGKATDKSILKAMRAISKGDDPSISNGDDSSIHPDFMKRVVAMCRRAECDDIGIANAMGVDVDLIRNSRIEEIPLTKDQVRHFIRTIFPIVQTAYLGEAWATKTKPSNAARGKG